MIKNMKENSIKLNKEEVIKFIDMLINRGFHFDGEGIHFTTGKDYIRDKKSGDEIVEYVGIKFSLE